MPMQETTSSHAASAGKPRNLRQALTRGWLGRCPECGNGKLFGSFIKPVHNCADCGEQIYHQRADDLPPYLVIFIVGHVVVAGYMLAEPFLAWNSWQHLALWIPVTLALGLVLLQPIKGAVIGLQWANCMHGFGDEPDDAAEAIGRNQGITTTEQ